MGIEVYSQTPASNDLANYFQTGMAPSKVKNAGWDIMADMAQQLLGMPTTGGTANAQTATNTRQFASLVSGMMQYVVFGATNTAAMTFAPDGLTAKNVFANGAAALAGQAISGQIGILKYDGTQWNLLNPSLATGSFTGTGVGWAATIPTATFTYITDGNRVTISENADAMSGTSNSTGTSITGLPTILKPSATRYLGTAVVVDAATGNFGRMSITSAGVWTLYLTSATSATTWTASSTKALRAGSWTYQI